MNALWPSASGGRGRRLAQGLVAHGRQDSLECLGVVDESAPQAFQSSGHFPQGIHGNIGLQDALVEKLAERQNALPIEPIQFCLGKSIAQMQLGVLEELFQLATVAFDWFAGIGQHSRTVIACGDRDLSRKSGQKFKRVGTAGNRLAFGAEGRMHPAMRMLI